MSPITTEENLEEELASIQQNLHIVRLEISRAQDVLDKLQTNLMACRLELSKKKEELRIFRAMYPGICRPPEN